MFAAMMQWDCYNVGMDQDNHVRSHDDPLAIEEPSRAKPRLALATLDLRWLVTALFAVSVLANVVVPICVKGIEGSLHKWNATVYKFRLSEWIGGIAYGIKLGELLMLGVFLALGNYA